MSNTRYVPETRLYSNSIIEATITLKPQRHSRIRFLTKLRAVKLFHRVVIMWFTNLQKKTLRFENMIAEHI